MNKHLNISSRAIYIWRLMMMGIEYMVKRKSRRSLVTLQSKYVLCEQFSIEAWTACYWDQCMRNSWSVSACRKVATSRCIIGFWFIKMLQSVYFDWVRAKTCNLKTEGCLVDMMSSLWEWECTSTCANGTMQVNYLISIFLRNIWEEIGAFSGCSCIVTNHHRL